LHDGVQIRKRGAPLRHPHLCQVRGRRDLPAGPPRVSGHPLQPVRRCALRHRVPHHGDVPAAGRDRRLRQGRVHRVQGVHRRLPVRRHLHQPRRPLGGEVQLLRPPDRHGAGAGVRRGLPHRSHPRRRPQRSGIAGRPDRPPGARHGAAHQAPWGWQVSLYTWTKGIAAGAYLVPLLLILGGWLSWTSVLWFWSAPVLAAVFLAATAALLIADLEHPERFYLILTRPQHSSWLVKGAFIIAGYALVLAGHVAAAFLGGSEVQAALAVGGLPLAV